MRTALLAGSILATALAGAACRGNTVTAPTATTTTTTTASTVADASIVEDFNSTLPVGGSKLYSFTVTEYGTVTVKLGAVGGAFVPATVQLALGLGTPAGTDCSVTNAAMTAPSATPQITSTLAAGIYCVRVADAGNLFAPAQFDVTIAHP